MKKNFKFGQKNNWRKQAWNLIVERLSVKPRDALVVYLAGEQDLDRAIAKAKGFRDENLLAVERDVDSLKTLRSRGVLAIQSDFIDAVNAIASKRRVDVVFGDFVSGLEMLQFKAIHGFLEMPNLVDSVFAFNFQRGRDASSNCLRDNRFYDDEPQWVAESLKHRGRLLFYYLRTRFIVLLGDATYEALTAKYGETLFLNWLEEYLGNRMMPKFLSYKSGHLNFDSVIFKSFLSGMGFESKTKINLNAKSPTQKTKGRCAAILAHRTIRQKSHAYS